MPEAGALLEMWAASLRKSSCLYLSVGGTICNFS